MFEIGSSLREARERQGRTLADLGHATQIRVRYLKALEEEQFDLLPAPAYARGFLRVYADELGLDGQLYVDEFNSRFTVGEEEQAPFRRREKYAPPARHSRRVASTAVVLSLGMIVALSALLFVAFSSNPAEQQTIPNLSGNTNKGKANVTTLKITAVGGDSFADVRSEDANGDSLYGGTLIKGHSRTFTAPKIWVRVTALQNLRWTRAGGVSFRFRDRVGPAILLFTPSGQRFLSR